jgi:hypothetical protein
MINTILNICSSYFKYRMSNHVCFVTFFSISSVLSIGPDDIYTELIFATIAPYSYIGCLAGSMCIGIYKKFIQH